MSEVTIDEAELANIRQAGTDAAAALEASTQREAAATASASEATGALADTLRAANPDLPPEAIAGATAAELTASVTSARAIATHALAAHTAANTTTPPTTPAGAGQAAAPARTTNPNPTGLTGVARIRAGLMAAGAKKE